MKTVIVASTNPVKIDAARSGFTRMFPGVDFDFIGVKADSHVAEQPMSSDQTLTGARNRVAHARELSPTADYWVAFEGGLEPREDKLTSVIWVVIQDTSGRIGESRCAGFDLPNVIAELVRLGKTLGAADDIVFHRTNSNTQNGAIGILTNNVLTRTSVYAEGCVFALAPFVNAELYDRAPLPTEAAA